MLKMEIKDFIVDLACFIIFVSGACCLETCSEPPEAFQKVSKCLTSELPPHINNEQPRLEMLPFIGGNNTKTDVLHHLCLDSKYETSLTCIQEFVSGCPRDVQQAVSEVINTKSLRRAMQKLCDSIHVYDKAKACYQSHKGPVEQCLEEQISIAMDHQDKAQTTAEKHEAVCRGTEYGINCIDDRLRPDCGGAAADLIKQFNQENAPPNCVVASATARQASTLVCIMSMVLVFLTRHAFES